jgi:hypothetical protein
LMNAWITHHSKWHPSFAQKFTCLFITVFCSYKIFHFFI